MCIISCIVFILLFLPSLQSGLNLSLPNLTVTFVLARDIQLSNIVFWWLIRHSYVIFGFFTSIKNSSRELIAGPLTNTTGTFATIRGIEVNEIVSGSCMSYAFFGGSVSNFPKKAHTLIIKNFGLLNLGPTNFEKILEKVLTWYRKVGGRKISDKYTLVRN